MKRFALILFALVLFATPAIAAFNPSAAAKLYLDDSVMLSLRSEVANNNAAYISGYCGGAGETLAEQFGSNQPALFELGLRNQDAQTYAAACRAIFEINRQATADDLRALSFVLGTMLTDDAVNQETIPVNNMLYVVNFFNGGDDDFGFYSTVRSMIKLSENHPNGLPVIVKKFFGAVFLGRTNTAMEVLKNARPDDAVKNMVRNISERENG